MIPGIIKHNFTQITISIYADIQDHCDIPYRLLQFCLDTLKEK